MKNLKKYLNRSNAIQAAAVMVLGFGLHIFIGWPNMIGWTIGVIGGTLLFGDKK